MQAYSCKYDVCDNAVTAWDQSALDPNHTHFILVDNGTQGKFATEIDFRAEFERHVTQKRHYSRDGADRKGKRVLSKTLCSMYICIL